MFSARLRVLASTSPTRTCSDVMVALQVAAEYMARFFEDLGLEDVQLQDFSCCGGTLARNVVAVRGRLEDELSAVAQRCCFCTKAFFEAKHAPLEG